MVFFAHDFARQAGAVWFYFSTSSYTTGAMAMSFSRGCGPPEVRE
jgi:hypothetical protein